MRLFRCCCSAHSAVLLLLPLLLQLWWSWEVGELAGREVMGATPALRRAHDDVHVVQHCMASMLESLTALKA